MKKLFVIGMAALLLVVFTMPAVAKVKIGGIVFTDFYYLSRDKENAHRLGKGDDSYGVTGIQVPNITRLYGRWTNEDNVGMYIEFGVGQGSGDLDESSSGDFLLRHAYGWWDINPGFQLLLGKTTTPFSPLNPSQLLGTRSGTLNIIGVGYGDFYSGRFAQVRGSWKFGKTARLEVCLVDPNGTMAAVGDFGPWDTAQNDSKIPRIDIGVPLYFGPVHVYPSFLWQYRKVDNATPAGVDDGLNTYIGSLAAKMGFGPFGVALEGQWGKNWGNTRGLIGTSPSAAISSAALSPTNTIEDAETWSVWIDLWYKFGPVVPHFMYGTMKSKSMAYAPDTEIWADVEARTQMYGFSIPIDLAKGFRLRPEIMWYDDGDTKYSAAQGSISSDNGKYAIYGVQFQITF
jgi:hypothetical protein